MRHRLPPSCHRAAAHQRLWIGAAKEQSGDEETGDECNGDRAAVWRGHDLGRLWVRVERFAVWTKERAATLVVVVAVVATRVAVAVEN